MRMTALYKQWLNFESLVRHRIWRSLRIPKCFVEVFEIVISRWLEDVANRLAEPSDYIPNGLDFIGTTLFATPFTV